MATTPSASDNKQPQPSAERKSLQRANSHESNDKENENDRRVPHVSQMNKNTDNHIVYINLKKIYKFRLI